MDKIVLKPVIVYDDPKYCTGNDGRCAQLSSGYCEEFYPKHDRLVFDEINKKYLKNRLCKQCFKLAK